MRFTSGKCDWVAFQKTEGASRRHSLTATANGDSRRHLMQRYENVQLFEYVLPLMNPLNLFAS